jgi:hypothetical protein
MVAAASMVTASTPFSAIEDGPVQHVHGHAQRRAVVAVPEDVQQDRDPLAGDAHLADDAGLGHGLDAMAAGMVDRPAHPAVGELVVPVPGLDADRCA